MYLTSIYIYQIILIFMNDIIKIRTGLINATMRSIYNIMIKNKESYLDIYKDLQEPVLIPYSDHDLENHILKNIVPNINSFDILNTFDICKEAIKLSKQDIDKITAKILSQLENYEKIY